MTEHDARRKELASAKVVAARDRILAEYCRRYPNDSLVVALREYEADRDAIAAAIERKSCALEFAHPSEVG